jgi:hypothetical protein
MSAQLHGGTVGGRGGVSRKMSIQRVEAARTIKAPASPTFRAPSGPAQVSLPSRDLPLYSLSPSTSPATYNRTVPYQPTPVRRRSPRFAAQSLQPQQSSSPLSQRNTKCRCIVLRISSRRSSLRSDTGLGASAGHASSSPGLSSLQAPKSRSLDLRPSQSEHTSSQHSPTPHPETK